ncbi:MAG: universal stress protein [Gammaproteobacteria bacterium]|nr:universal stress protein [Gammaproteobacteria bacterium]
MEFARILVATDFSEAGQRAVRLAASWAARHRAELRIVHVAPPARWLTGTWGRGRTALQRIHAQASAMLARVALECDPAHALQVSTGLLTGKASTEIAKAAAEFDCSLLVLGARGGGALSGAESGLGGTATKLLDRSAQPLLLVRHADMPPAERVLAAVDLAPVSRAVVAAARSCAQGQPLRVLHAYSVPFAERLESYGYSDQTVDVYSADEQTRRTAQVSELTADVRGLPTEIVVTRGDAARVLLDHIRVWEPTLVVVGQHSRTARRSSASPYASVAHYVTTYARTNVLVTPAPPQ